MAINIYSGGSKPGAKTNSAAASTRAQQAKSALASPSETSNSGATAVAAKGDTLSKVGNFVGKAAGIASKFLPGIGGTIAKGLSNLLNDPEWWQSVPGDAVTLNMPLRVTQVNEDATAGTKFSKVRPAFLEITHAFYDDDQIGDLPGCVFNPDENMVTQYLMPQIRKVVNAIPLQAAKDYRDVLAVNATIYALWRQLKRDDYLLKHGQTYIPNLDQGFNPLYSVDNAAFLQTTINRLEEHLRSNVRLPHTLCEYLAWRFGRVYKSVNSAKAALVIYNVYDATISIDNIKARISELLSFSASTTARQQANTDMYNAYFDHDLMVEIRDDTQFTYDNKEFALRTNLQIIDYNTNAQENSVDNLIYIDSALDNPTAFMASSISTPAIGYEDKLSVLVPVVGINIYTYNSYLSDAAPFLVTGSEGAAPSGNAGANVIMQKLSGTSWCKSTPFIAFTGTPQQVSMIDAVAAMLVIKPVDLYNKGLYVQSYAYSTSTAQGGDAGVGSFDITCLSMDCAIVPDLVVYNEQIYAFANLMDIDRKTSMSYKQATKLVAKDTANFVESLDIATAKS